jgi:hypothetical protein
MLLLSWYSFYKSLNPLVLAFLVPAAFIGGFVGIATGLLICLSEYAFKRTMGVIVRSLIGVCFILILIWSVVTPPLKYTPGDWKSLIWLIVDLTVALVLVGVMPGIYAGAFAATQVSQGAANGIRRRKL